MNTSEPTTTRFADRDGKLGMLLTCGMLAGIIAAAGLTIGPIVGIMSEPVLPAPPSPAETRLPPAWTSLPSGDAEYEFIRSRRAAQLDPAQEQLRALRERWRANDADVLQTGPTANVLVRGGAAKPTPPAELLVPRNAVVKVSGTCPDGWKPYVNADGEPLYFPFALLEEEEPGAGLYHPSLLAACRKP